MCVYSMVIDNFTPKFEPFFKTVPAPAAIDVLKLIEDFAKAREAAKLVDEITGQPDCEDPEKLKLVERVAELEAQLAAFKWVVKQGSMYWGVEHGWEGWITSQKKATRFFGKQEAKTFGRGRVVKLVKQNP